jgi:hypothetical protein
MGARQTSKTSGPSSVSRIRGPKPTKPDANAARKKKLNELIKLVTETAEAMGWRAEVSSRDLKTHRFAAISVSRTASGSPVQYVTGLFDITCHNRVRITYNKTSFHSTGLTDLYQSIADEFWKLPWVKPKDKEGAAPPTPSELALLNRLLRRFHRMARQIKRRHDNRLGFPIQDEYDLQDLLHAVFRGLFDDIRSEEHTPSYAGGASRMDFLLKAEQIVIETKFASASLRDKQLGEELIVDIGRYQSHPDCKTLICFVYDPEGNLRNPAGLEADLSRAHGKLEVKVIVVSP